MRLHASRKGFCDRAVEIVCQSVPCFALLIVCWSPSASDSPHQVDDCDIERPDHVEAFEHGEDLVV
jgi:hypothetical protein